MSSFDFTYCLESEGRLLAEIDAICLVDVDETFTVYFTGPGRKTGVPSWMKGNVDLFVQTECLRQLQEAQREARHDGEIYYREIAKALRGAA